MTPLTDGPPPAGEVRETVSLALAKAVEGRLRPVVGATYPLECAAEAHRALAARAVVGKALLLVS